MHVIESGILGGQEDWQRIAEMIRSIARRELGETSGKVSTAGRREAYYQFVSDFNVQGCF